MGPPPIQFFHTAIRRSAIVALGMLYLPSERRHGKERIMDKPSSSPTDETREVLLRRYALGGVTWHELRERGFEDYVEVLGGLGELGLRPPIAPMEGPNREARERGRALLRRLLHNQTAP